MAVAVSLPISVDYGTGGKIFPGKHVGGTVGRVISGHQVMAALDGDASLELLFPLPATNPGGTLKLMTTSIADVAGTTVGKMNPAWEAIAATESLDQAVPTAEGVETPSHTTTLDDDAVVTLTTLDSDTVVYGTDRFIQMSIKFETSGWTLAVVSTWLFELIWE